MVLKNLNLIHNMLKTFTISSQDYEDYFNEGVLALINAVDNYDANKGYAFSTYACKAILNHLTKYKHNNTYIKFPEEIKALRQKYLFLTWQDPSISEEEIAKKLNCSQQLIREMNIIYSPISLFEYVNSEEDKTYKVIDTIPVEDVYFSDIKSIYNSVQDCIHKIPIKNERNRDLLRDYVNSIICDEKHITMDDLGEKYNLSRQRVSEILKKYLQLLRKALKEELEGDK
jgi:RNA polymerase sigma factor (sigma-70 family)